jgi:hypothetical protein
VKARFTVHPDSNAPSRRALIVIPGSMNYVHNLSGRRVAEAFGELGLSVDVVTLDDCPSGDYDLGVLSNIPETVHSGGDFNARMARITEIGGRCRALVTLSLECVSTDWYRRIRDYGARAGVSLILDLGLLDQGPFLDRQDRANYRFVFSGLTPSEARLVESLDEDDTERTIPWAFVGAMTAHRAALADRLVQCVNPRGFLYMPTMAPYTESGSPHLNQEQFERVLRRTRYQVWRSHHPYFYMETERFRTSLLTGGVPIKIVESRDEVPESVPLRELVIEAADVGERLTAGAFAGLRRRFRDDWRRFPTLSQALADVLEEIGIGVSQSALRAREFEAAVPGRNPRRDVSFAYRTRSRVTPLRAGHRRAWGSR